VSKKPTKAKRGPKPETLVIKGRWEDAVSQAMKKSPASPKATKPRKGRP
jgi:hypothetical protein